MPMTTSTTSTSSAGPSTFSGNRGSAWRVIDQTARICATRPFGASSDVPGRSFAARAMGASIRGSGQPSGSAANGARPQGLLREALQGRVHLFALSRTDLVAGHGRPGVASGSPLTTVSPDVERDPPGDVENRLLHDP